jgi:Tol biopolymer transport system component
MDRDIEKVLKEAARTTTRVPNIEVILRRGRRRLWATRFGAGLLTVALVGGVGVSVDWPRFFHRSHARPGPTAGVGDGAGIVFGGVGDIEREDGAIFVIDPAREERRQIVDEPVGGEMAPVWSPDRTMIAFSMNVTPGEDPDTVDTNMEIFVVDAGGRDLRRLTYHPGLDTNPSWSPDGRRIAFTRFPDGSVRESGSDAAIWSIAVDGSSLRQLTDGPGLVDHPSWSLKGEIAFERYVAEEDTYDIFVMDAGGDDVKRLGHTPDGSNTQPAWSPDGLRIAFVNDVDQNRQGGDNVYVADIGNGTEATRVTARPGSFHDVAWSTDGGALALIRSVEREGSATPEERIVVLRVERRQMHGIGEAYERLNGLDW